MDEDKVKQLQEVMRKHKQRMETDPEYKKKCDEIDRKLEELGFFRWVESPEEM